MRSKTKVKRNGGIKSPLTPINMIVRIFSSVTYTRYSGRCYSKMIWHASIRAARRRVCMVSTFSRVWINLEKNPARRQLNREKKHVSLSPFVPENLVQVRPSHLAPAYSFSTLRLNLGLTHGIPHDFRDGAHIYRQPPLDVSPKFIGSRNHVPITFTAESPLAQGQ